MRLHYRFRDWIGRLILFTYLTPSALLFIPLSVIIARLNLGNTLHGLIFVYLTFAAPLSTWLLMGYFQQHPGRSGRAGDGGRGDTSAGASSASCCRWPRRG